MNLTTVLQFHKFFPRQWINNFAKETGLIKRSTSKFNGYQFFQLLLQAVHAPSELSLNGFCNILYQISGNSKLTAQSLWERIVNRHTVSFIKGVYARTWSLYSERIGKDCCKLPDFLKNFTQILIEDSSIVPLHEKLSGHFKGSGGAASSSSLKIHLIFNMISSKFILFEIYKDNRPDNRLVYEALQFVTQGTLLIRDLGFFVLDAFKKIKDQNAFYISRLHPSVNIYLKSTDSKSINLVKYLQTKYKLFSRGSLEVFLGHEKLPVRLIFYKTPQDIIKQRKLKAKRNRRRKGNKASEHLLKWQEYTFLITNLSEEVAATGLIGTVYRLRWDIELTFKTWKSHLRLDVLKGTRSERIEVFLYTKMIGILLQGMMCEHLKKICAKMFLGAEISEAKVAKFLMSINIFSELFEGKKKTVTFTEKYWIKRLCKQKRHRKTTLERINTLESFGMAIF